MKSPELGRGWPVWLAFFSCWALLATPAQAFDLQGHRGARGLAPENTLAAFATALDIGVTTLELDLAVTRDGVVVIAHDQRLNPNFTRDAKGQWLQSPTPALHALSWAELQTYDVGRLKPGTRYAENFPEQKAFDGQRVPTLDALFEFVKQRGNAQVRFNIETKLTPDTPDLSPTPEAFVSAVLAVVDRHGLRQRVSLQSFDWRTLRAAQALAPRLQTVALSTQQGTPYNIADARWTAGLRLRGYAQDHASVPQMVKALGAAVWSPHQGDVTQELVQAAHALGLQVIPWTVNEPAQMDKLMAWGVDGLITDRPDLARSVMAKRGLPLP